MENAHNSMKLITFAKAMQLKQLCYSNFPWYIIKYFQEERNKKNWSLNQPEPFPIFPFGALS